MISRLTVALVASVVLMCSVAGCAAIGGAVSDATGGTVNVGGTAIPSDFPDAVPVIEGDIVTAGSVGEDAGRVFSVVVAVDDASAFSTIAGELKTAGFVSNDDLVPGESTATTGGYSDGTYGVLVVVAETPAGDWVATYTVSRLPA
jgi:hypothetical protein